MKFKKIGSTAVVLIDEYDSPLTNTLNKRDVHIELRNELKNFYGVMEHFLAFVAGAIYIYIKE